MHPLTGSAVAWFVGMALLTTPASGQQPWKLSVGFAEGSLYWDHLGEFATAVTKFPHAETTLEVVPDKRSPEELISLLQSGEIASASIPLSALSAVVPGLEIYNEPFLSRGYDASLGIAQLAAYILSEELQESSLRLLYTIPRELRGLYSVAKIDSFDQLDGAKFVAFDYKSSELASSLGADVTTVDPAEFADAFVEAEAAFASPGFGVASDAARHYGFFYDLQILPELYGIIMGEKTYSELSEAGQTRLQDIARMAELDIWAQVRRQDDRHIRTLGEAGISVLSPTPDMRTSLDQMAASVGERITPRLGHSPIAAESMRGFESSDSCIVFEIAFATDRLPDSASESPYKAGPELTELQFGLVTVAEGLAFPTLRPGDIACEELEGSGDCWGDIEERGCLSWEELDEDGWTQRVLANEGFVVFTHGYRTQIGEAARSVHKLVQGLRINRMPVLFSWPTMETALGSVLAYPGDRETALTSSSHLKELVEVLTAEGGRVDLIAHSMGTFVTVEAMKELFTTSSIHSGAGGVGEIVLIAADLSREELVDRTLPTFAGQVARTTIYASRNDCALLASEKTVMLKPRVGKIPPETLDARMDTIDVTEVNNDLSGKGHSYHLSSPEVVIDVADVLKGGMITDRTNLEAAPNEDDGALLLYRRSGGAYGIAAMLSSICG